MSGPEHTRCCANCGVSFVIQPPVVADPTRPNIRPDAKQIRVCRLNPPEIMVVEVPSTDRRGVMTKERRQNLSQNITDDNWVCWHWVPPGYLPGERLPPYHHGQREAIDDILGQWLKAQGQPQAKQ